MKTKPVKKETIAVAVAKPPINQPISQQAAKTINQTCGSFNAAETTIEDVIHNICEKKWKDEIVLIKKIPHTTNQI